MIKLLVVDDSPLMRRLLTDIFSQTGEFEVEVARDGAEALAKLLSFKPDVITLDITMPGMDGLTCLDRIMLERPCPVVVLSALTTEGAEESLEAMALGAVEVLPKPRGALSIELDATSQQLIDTVRAASQVTIPRTARLVERLRLQRLRGGRTHADTGAEAHANTPPQPRTIRAAARAADQMLVLLGSSTGGPPALDVVLGDLAPTFPAPIVVAQHMPANFTGPLARRLDKLCAITVSEVIEPTILQPGHAYIGRGDRDLLITQRNGAVAAMPAPSSAEYHWHPSVDRLVASAMRHVAPQRLIGVLLTGMGSDGASTMTELKAAGGHTIAESEETAVVWGMPGSLVQAGGAEFVAPLDRIGSVLTTLVS